MTFELRVEDLAEMRVKHCSTKPEGEHGQCVHCMIPGWPCVQSQVLDLAISAWRFRATLERLRTFTRSRQSNNIAAVVYESVTRTLGGTP